MSTLLERVNPVLAKTLPKRPEPPKAVVVDKRSPWLRRRDDGLLPAKVLA